MPKNKTDEKRNWLGFDLGGTKMYAVVYDENLKVLGTARKKTKALKGQEEGLQRMVDTAREALETAGVDSAQLAGIGIGSPGPLDLNKGIMIETPNLGWKKTPLAATFQKAFACPAHVLNDVDAGLYGEYTFGAAKGTRTAVGIFPGTGIGGACVYEGQLLRGAEQSCMEIGHIPVQPNGPLCGCGKRGCLESVASRLSISAAAAAAAARGEAPALVAAVGSDVLKMRSNVLRDAVAAGDKSVEIILRQAAQWIGVAAAAVVNLLLPDVIVLGGGLVEALPELFVSEVDKTARERVMPSFTKTFKIEAARLGDDAAALGAAAWARAAAGKVSRS